MEFRSTRASGIIVLGLVAALAAPCAFAERLPVYKLAAAKVDAAKGRDLFTKAMGGQPSKEENEHAIVHRAGKKVVEIDKRSGHIFMGDMEKMWNPEARANVPDEARSKEAAEKFLKDHGLGPTSDKRVKVSFSHFSETGGSANAPGPMQKTILDRQVNYKTEIVVQTPAGEKTVPVHGGGGKTKVVVGDRGAVVGFQGGWREISGVESEEELLPEASAQAEFKKKYGTQQVKNVQSRLAYYAAPAFEEQQVLAPVWIVSGELQIGQEGVPLRDVVIPATKYGPKDEATPSQQGRDPNEKPNPNHLNDSDGPGGQKPQSGLFGPSGLSDALFPPAYAEYESVKECGTDWIGISQGLSGSYWNTRGFINQCSAAGWTTIFDYGESNAWERDFRLNDDWLVDAADLVFYTGHANQNGWVVNAPDDTFLLYTEVQNAGFDLYGNVDLEWLIIAACGPMQSTHFTTNTTNAFTRWSGIFDGLHVFLGYGAVTNDNTSEGRRFMELARAGWNVIDAWFRTAWEIQPYTNGYSAPNGPYIKVTAMYAHNGNHCARYDRLWGMGTTCPDVTGAGQYLYFMWAGT